MCPRVVTIEFHQRNFSYSQDNDTISSALQFNLLEEEDRLSTKTTSKDKCLLSRRFSYTYTTHLYIFTPTKIVPKYYN